MKFTTASEVDLGHEKVGKLLFMLAVPAILSQIVNLLYNVVDRMYIGHIQNVGAIALTGVGVCLPNYNDCIRLCVFSWYGRCSKS